MIMFPEIAFAHVVYSALIATMQAKFSFIASSIRYYMKKLKKICLSIFKTLSCHFNHSIFLKQTFSTWMIAMKRTNSENARILVAPKLERMEPYPSRSFPLVSSVGDQFKISSPSVEMTVWPTGDKSSISPSTSLFNSCSTSFRR